MSELPAPTIVGEGGYQPSKWQREFHELTTTEALGGGAAGPGKTETLLMEPIPKVWQEHQRCSDPNHPFPLEWGHSKGWALFLRRTMPMLLNTLTRAKIRYHSIDPDVKWNENDHIFTFSSGYKVQFGHCKDPDSHEGYLGQEYDLILYDELVQFEEEQYNQINKRLRSVDALLRYQLKIRGMTNPLAQQEGMETVRLKNPNWVRDYFVKPAPEGGVIIPKVITLRSGEKVTRTRIYLKATLYDHPDPEFIRIYEADLQDSPEHIRRAYLYGDWDSLQGGYFADVWNARLHVIPSFAIPATWRMWRSMDWGYVAPGCVHWWAMDEDGNVYCVHEYWFKGLTATQVAKRIHVIEKDLGLWPSGQKKSQLTGPADSQLWERRGETAKSKAEEFAAEGIFWVVADKKSRGNAAMRVHQRLKDHDFGTKRPGLMIFSRCQHLIQTLPVMQIDPKSPSGEPMDGGDDHAIDSCFYSCSFASHGIKGIPPRRAPKDDDAEFDEMGDNRRRVASRGRDGYGGG